VLNKAACCDLLGNHQAIIRTKKHKKENKKCLDFGEVRSQFYNPTSMFTLGMVDINS